MTQLTHVSYHPRPAFADSIVESSAWNGKLMFLFSVLVLVLQKWLHISCFFHHLHFIYKLTTFPHLEALAIPKGPWKWHIYLHGWQVFKVNLPGIFWCKFLGWWSVTLWKVVGDLQLGDQKVTVCITLLVNILWDASPPSYNNTMNVNRIPQTSKWKVSSSLANQIRIPTCIAKSLRIITLYKC